MNSPRVFFVGNYIDMSSGTRAISEDLALRLEDVGWSVILVSRKLNKMARLGDMVNATWKRRADYDVAVVDVYSGPAFFWAECVCQLLSWLGKPFVLTLHGGGLPWFAERYPARVRRLLSTAHQVTVPSGYLSEKMHHYRDRGLRLVPNPLPVNLYPCRLRRKLKPKLVWLRAFHRIYDPLMPIEAVNELRADVPEITLSMVGPDKDGSLALAKSRVKSLGLSDIVSFPGPALKAEIPAKLGEADIFLNSATVDNAPVSVLEAMACGLCIISTKVGGIPYLLRDQEDSLLVPVGDSASLAAAVRRLLSEHDLAARISFNARQKAMTLDWSSVLPEWEALLRCAAGTSAHKSELAAQA